MQIDLLSTYLNNHLAGSVFALDLLEHCQSKHASATEAATLDQLHAEIKADQAVLKEIMARLGVTESDVKKTGAWLSEKALRLSSSGSEPRQVSFDRLHEMEALLLGVRGKLAIWDVLETVFTEEQKLRDLDWSDLKGRANSQLQRIEELRVLAAREAFLTDASSVES